LADANFTPEAYDALRHASREAERWGDPMVTPDHLLLALLRGEDTSAARVLAHFGIPLPPLIGRLERYLSWAGCEEQAEIRTAHARKADDPHAGHMLPRTGLILDQAAAEARLHGRPVIGTEHLLYGIVREGGSLGAWLLQRHGLRAGSLSAELAVRLSEALRIGNLRMGASAAQVQAINAVTGLALLGLLWGAIALVHVLGILHDLDRSLWPGLLRAVWAAGLALSSIRPGMALERAAWPRMQALLFASSAGAAALLTAALTGLAPGLSRVGLPLAFYLVLVASMTNAMFRARSQFGIEARDGWRSLWREGGGYLIVSAVLELLTLAGYVLRH